MQYKYTNSEFEWIGEHPKHWKLFRIGQRVENVVSGEWGSDPDATVLNDHKEIAVLRVSNFQGIYLNYDDITIRSVKTTKIPTRIINSNCLLIEKSGGGEKQLVGRVVEAKNLPYDAITSNFIARIEFDSKVNTHFMNYIFYDLYNSDLNFPYIQQTTGIQNINITYYLNIKVPFPPKPEQTAIAEYLDKACADIDRVVKIKRKQIDLIDKYFNTKVFEATTKGLDKNATLKAVKSKWIKGIPEHWEVKKIKRLSKVFRGKFTHRPRNDERLYNGEYPFIQTGNVTNAKKYINDYQQTLNDWGKSVSEMFPAGTLTMTIAANIADVAILNFNACFPDSIVGFKPRHFIQLEYLFYLFQAIKQDFLSTAIVTTQMNLNIVRIGNVEGFVPPKKEQIEIITYLNDLSDKIDNVKSKVNNQIETLLAYKKSLIHEVVTGKKQVYFSKQPEETVESI